MNIKVLLILVITIWPVTVKANVFLDTYQRAIYFFGLGNEIDDTCGQDPNNHRKTTNTSDWSLSFEFGGFEVTPSVEFSDNFETMKIEEEDKRAEWHNFRSWRYEKCAVVVGIGDEEAKRNSAEIFKKQLNEKLDAIHKSFFPEKAFYRPIENFVCGTSREANGDQLPLIIANGPADISIAMTIVGGFFWTLPLDRKDESESELRKTGWPEAYKKTELTPVGGHESPLSISLRDGEALRYRSSGYSEFTITSRNELDCRWVCRKVIGNNSKDVCPACSGKKSDSCTISQ